MSPVGLVLLWLLLWLLVGWMIAATVAISALSSRLDRLEKRMPPPEAVHVPRLAQERPVPKKAARAGKGKNKAA